MDAHPVCDECRVKMSTHLCVSYLIRIKKLNLYQIRLKKLDSCGFPYIYILFTIDLFVKEH